MTTSATTHVLTSLAFLQRADQYLSRSSLAAASRNGWLAAASMLRGTARSKGWRFLGPRGLDEVVDRLVDLYGDEDLWDKFASSEALDINSYDDCMSPATVEIHLAQIRQLIRSLEHPPA